MKHTSIPSSQDINRMRAKAIQDIAGFNSSHTILLSPRGIQLLKELKDLKDIPQAIGNPGFGLDMIPYSREALRSLIQDRTEVQARSTISQHPLAPPSRQ